MDDQKTVMTFYDIASGPPIRPFAPNPWKARYALNFTRTPYRTVWVPLPEVAATRKRLGVPPVRHHADGSEFHTLPLLFDPSAAPSAARPKGGTFVGDSFDIALHLHARAASAPATLANGGPRPVLFPPGTVALQRAFNQYVNALFSLHGVPLAGYYMPMDPATADATRADMCRRIGLGSWEDLNVPMGSARRAEMLKGFELALGEGAPGSLGQGLAAWYTRQDEGPFLEGATPMYADLCVGAWLQMLRNTLPEWEQLRGWHGGLWGRLHDALEQWADPS